MPHLAHTSDTARNRRHRRLKALRIATPWIGIAGGGLWTSLGAVDITAALGHDQVPLVVNLLLIAAGANCVGLWIMLLWTVPVREELAEHSALTTEALVTIGRRIVGLNTLLRDTTDTIDALAAKVTSLSRAIEANTRTVRQLGTVFLHQLDGPPATTGTNGHATPLLRSIRSDS